MYSSCSDERTLTMYDCELRSAADPESREKFGVYN